MLIEGAPVDAPTYDLGYTWNLLKTYDNRCPSRAQVYLLDYFVANGMTRENFTIPF